MQKVFVLSAKRSATGSYGGSLASLSAIDIATQVLQGVLAEISFDTKLIEQIVVGNVLSANLGQNPARQVALKAGLSNATCATNVNKVCASGMKAISMLMNDIALGNVEVGIAGGMESMSNAPHYLPKARFGLGYGHTTVIDGLAFDGLTDAYSQQSMGTCGDATAERYGISREQQDTFAENSFKRAIEHTTLGSFKAEIQPIVIKNKKGDVIVDTDEQISKVNFEKMRSLKPAFSATGTVTAANASPLSDGASFVMLASEDFVLKNNLKPLAQIIAYAEAEHEPTFFTTAPVSATRRLLNKTNVKVDSIDIFEVNEAFGVVPLVFQQELGIGDASKINPRGGAVALGHALGSSGSRIFVSLVHQLQQTAVQYGLAAICNGGGGASAILVEQLNV